jgi:hypothetical protein
MDRGQTRLWRMGMSPLRWTKRIIPIPYASWCFRTSRGFFIFPKKEETKTKMDGDSTDGNCNTFPNILDLSVAHLTFTRAWDRWAFLRFSNLLTWCVFQDKITFSIKTNQEYNILLWQPLT